MDRLNISLWLGRRSKMREILRGSLLEMENWMVMLMVDK